MENKTMRSILIGFLFGMIVTNIAAYIIIDNLEQKIVTVQLPCDNCDNTEIQQKLNLAKENYQYCKNIANENEETAIDLWDDYWACYTALVCSDGIQECYQSFYEEDPSITLADVEEILEFYNYQCSYAENYEVYYNKYEK